jgi:pre-mRNA-splicing factor 38B
MLNHPDSEYIRALGFLYLRFCGMPGELLDWFWEFLNDDTPIKVRQAGAAPAVPFGKYLRDLLLEPSYFSTRLPRIPVLIEKQIREELEKNPFGSAPAAAPAAAGGHAGSTAPCAFHPLVSIGALPHFFFVSRAR